MHREGLIYKDNRRLNWDPKLLSGDLDLECAQVEVKGRLVFALFPEGRTFNRGSLDVIVVGLRRRARHDARRQRGGVPPDDDRYTPTRLPRSYPAAGGTKIPILADEYSDPEGLGRGEGHAGHDFNDFEVFNGVARRCRVSPSCCESEGRRT